jgi:predicted transcriptional regulator
MSRYATDVACQPMPVTNSILLTRREREIMNAVFTLGNRASGDEVRVRLTSPSSDSAVRVMLARLEKKGCLKHQFDGPRHVYSATVSPAVAQRMALGNTYRLPSAAPCAR